MVRGEKCSTDLKEKIVAAVKGWQSQGVVAMVLGLTQHLSASGSKEMIVQKTCWIHRSHGGQIR